MIYPYMFSILTNFQKMFSYDMLNYVNMSQFSLELG